MPASNRPALRFSTGRSLFLATLIVLLVLGSLEILLRLVGLREPVQPRILLRSIDVDVDFPFMRPDPDLFWSPRPGFRGEFLGKPVTINSYGLRGLEPRSPKPTRSRRVACFGDSITFGYGVGDDETYPQQLTAALAHRGAEVVNAGVTGYTSHQVLALLRRLTPRLQLDVATFCVGWNDASLRPVDDRTYARRLRAAMAADSALDRLYLYRGVKALYLSLLPTAEPGAATGPRVPLEHYRENLTAIVEYCRAQRVTPVFITLPRRARAGEPPFDSPHARALIETARSLGVAAVEPAELALGSTTPNEALFIDTLHFSPSGHKRMAEVLAPALGAILARAVEIERGSGR